MKKKDLLRALAQSQLDYIKLDTEFHNFKEDVKSRDELMQSSFTLGLKDKGLLKELNDKLFNGLSFYEVKRQIKIYDFTNLEELLLFIDTLKKKEKVLDEYRPTNINKKNIKK